MDNIEQLLPFITKLGQNPEALSALATLMGAASAPPKQAEVTQGIMQSVGQNIGHSSGQMPTELISSIMGALGGQGGAQGQGARTEQGDPFSAIMSMLGGESRQGVSEQKSGGLSVSKIFGTPDEIKNRIVLLNAVRPYLSEERRQRLETVVRLLRLAELGSLGNLLG